MKLEARELVKRYGKRLVVGGVSLEVSSGEVVGLLGANGAGKTTTFSMLVGLIRPSEGRILVDDSDITTFPMYRRARLGIGYLAQEASVFRRLSVEDNLRLVWQQNGVGVSEQEKRLQLLLEELELTRVRELKGVELSGGERRRVEIARCLALSPKFLLLDEPFTGVDPIAVAEIQRIVSRLRKKGIGVLITDHNVRETLAITDRAYIIREGKILVSGDAPTIAASPLARKYYLGDSYKTGFES